MRRHNTGHASPTTLSDQSNYYNYYLFIFLKEKRFFSKWNYIRVNNPLSGIHAYQEKQWSNTHNTQDFFSSFTSESPIDLRTYILNQERKEK